jgi:hypothetical protein
MSRFGLAFYLLFLPSAAFGGSFGELFAIPARQSCKFYVPVGFFSPLTVVITNTTTGLEVWRLPGSQVQPSAQCFLPPSGQNYEITTLAQ